MSDEVTRRTYLEGLLASGVAVSIAGCNASQDGSSPDTTAGTPTATPNQAPRIINHSATPQDNGTSLAVHLEGEDDHGIQTAVIQYGEQELRETPDDTEITLDSELTGLGDGSLQETPGQVIYRLQDTDGKETRAEAYPDETAPELQTFSAEPTDNASEIALLLEGRDDVGLEHVAANLLGEESLLEAEVAGHQEYSTDQTAGVSGEATFQEHTVTASLEDWNGNTTESETDTYVRKYDVMEETRIDIGAIYLTWMGGMFGGALSREEVEPRVGYYESLREQQNEVVNQHIDQMQGHGVNNVMVTFGDHNGDQRFRNFESADLTNKINFEAFVALPTVYMRNRELDEDLNFIRENLLGKSNYNTVNGRPIIQFWGPSYLVYSIKDQIDDEYGGLPEFVDHTREKLSKDGTDPFLVADAQMRGYYDGHSGFEGAEDFWAKWDGLTNWVGKVVPHETIPQDKSIEIIEQNYQGINEFAGKHDQDFYPMVIPGYNETHNEAWGSNRKIPRSTSAFRERLNLAEEFADDRINVYSFNEWAEGTQIEPGRLLDSEYGTEYLEVVEEFQRAE